MNLMWLRRDLRVADNPALYEACQAGTGVIAIHIETPKTWANHNMGLKQITWLRQNLDLLTQDLEQLGIPLLRLQTDYFSECPELILELIKQYKLKALYFNLEYEWDERRRDAKVISKLEEAEVKTYRFDEQCLLAPTTLYTKQNQAYRVFTPYKKASLYYLNQWPELLYPTPLPRSQTRSKVVIDKPLNEITSSEQSNLFSPGAMNAFECLENFIQNKIDGYQQDRDFPFLAATSQLSPYLALGIISVRQCLAKILDYYHAGSLEQVLVNSGVATWVSEILWRDFYKMICFNFPEVSRAQPFIKKTTLLQWDNNEHYLDAWQSGNTGFPIIDAAMRQLNQTGWMHNRLRMIVAMFFSKNLWLDWRLGEAYFASKLIDWDFAANNGGWQWCASTGTDAAPYFRVFNPLTQSERFDKEAKFIKKYCPELQSVAPKIIHNPTPAALSNIDYPKPLVDLKVTRQYAIEQFKAL